MAASGGEEDESTSSSHIFNGAEAAAFLKGPEKTDAGQEAKPIYAVDLIKADSFPKSMYETLISFQGIVNRDQPRLFIIRYDEDYFWLAALEAYYGYRRVMLDDPWQAFDQPDLKERCHGLILFGKNDCELALNVALTLGGIRGCAAMAVDDKSLAEMTKRGFSVQEDLRGRWPSNEEAQAWAFRNLRPQCTSDALAIARGSFKQNVGIDYAVQQRMFVLCLDSTGQYVKDRDTTQRDCLASYKPTIIYGFWSKEVPDIAFLSRFGHTDAGDGPNISVYSHLPKIEGLKQKTFDDPPAYDPTKTYIFVSFSQGDSLHFCQKYNLWHLTDKSATEPGKRINERYSFGLMHSTLQSDIQPIVPRALNDLVAAPGQWFSGKGYGYANPTTLEENGFLDLYLSRSKEAMRRMGIVDFMLNDQNVQNDPQRKIVTKIARVLQPRSIIMKHQLDPTEQFDDPLALVEGSLVIPDPVFDSADADKAGKFDAASTVERIEASAKKRQFFWVFLRHTVTVSDLEQLMDELTANHKDIAVLHPDVFIRLALSLAKDPDTAARVLEQRG
ncbi:MAG: GxGYxYP family putative glycoside hydrolase [Candidatus Sumerlaeota bacterium]|nr:GxGYxYP family putative glycoside hydrolase [Candidatus Sumerlaeota bacterium]